MCLFVVFFFVLFFTQMFWKKINVITSKIPNTILFNGTFCFSFSLKKKNKKNKHSKKHFYCGHNLFTGRVTHNNACALSLKCNYMMIFKMWNFEEAGNQISKIKINVKNRPKYSLQKAVSRCSYVENDHSDGIWE